MLERGVNSYACTQQRCTGGKVDVLGYPQYIVLIDHNGACVAAVAGFSVVVVTVIGLHISGAAEVLIATFARLAGSAGVHECADSNPISRLEIRNVLTDRSDQADDLMAWNHWVGSLKPLVSRLVNIAVANARVLDVDGNHLGA